MIRVCKWCGQKFYTDLVKHPEYGHDYCYSMKLQSVIPKDLDDNKT